MLEIPRALTTVQFSNVENLVFLCLGFKRFLLWRGRPKEIANDSEGIIANI